MWETILLVSAIILSWWCKNQIQAEIQAVVMLMGGSVRKGTEVYALIFLPGIIWHEITHFFTAAILGVPTGDINLFPQFQTESESKVALGSVKIGRSDFIRESLIGAAPFLSGSVAIYCLVTIFILPMELGAWLPQLATGKMIGVIYLILTIANTMFPSNEDTKAWPIVWLVGAIVVGILAVNGWLEKIGWQAWWTIAQVVQTIGFSFFMVLIFNLMLWFLLGLWQKLLERVTRRKVVKVGR